MSTSTRTPRDLHPLRKAFNALEKQIGGPLEGVLNTQEAGYVLLQAASVSRGAARRLRSVRSATVHMFELPSHRDVQVLSRTLTRLERRLDDVDGRLDDLDDQLRR